MTADRDGPDPVSTDPRWRKDGGLPEFAPTPRCVCGNFIYCATGCERFPSLSAVAERGGLRSDTCAAGAPGIATVDPPSSVAINRKTLEEILAALEGMASLIRRALEGAS